jgi:prophage antirepressor-like protein
MNELITKHFESSEVRFQLDDKGNPWFVAQDICSALGLKYTGSALRRLDQDQLMSLKSTSGGQIREFSHVNKSGVYMLIMRSNKPSAKKFTRWITDEVLPSIEATGSYSILTKPVLPPAETDTDPLDTLERYLMAMREYKRKSFELANRIKEVEIVAKQDDDTLTADQITEIDKITYAKAQLNTNSEADYWKYVRGMRGALKKKFYEPGMGSSRTYKELPRRDFQAAKQFIINYDIYIPKEKPQLQINMNS